MFVVCVHPDNGSIAFVDRVPVLQQETNDLMSIQRERARECFQLRALDKDPDPYGGGDSDDFCDLDARIEEEEMALFGDVGDDQALTPGRSGPPTPVYQPPVPAASQSSQPPLHPLERPLAVVENTLHRLETSVSMVADDEAHDASGITDAYKARRITLKGAASSSKDFNDLFTSCSSSADTAIRTIKKDQGGAAGTIMRKTTEIRAMVTNAHPDWPVYLIRLATAALAVYQMRLIDLTLREHVWLLWIFEGEDYLRVHSGIAFFYDDRGSFQAYKGIPPESTFGRVKTFLLHLEGLFRLFPHGLRRTDTDLLHAIDALHTRYTGLSFVYESLSRSFYLFDWK